MRLRPTIRVRLTLLYGGVVLIAGILLLGLTYVLVRNSVPTDRVAGTSGQSRPTATSQATPPPTAGQTPEEPGPGGADPAAQSVIKSQMDFEADTLRAILIQGGIALVVVTIAVLAVGWLIADRALRPIHAVTETARRVAGSQNLDERIGYDGAADDVKDLADSFDTMLGRLAGAFDGQRRFVANASHELRTPLAINRTLVDVAMRRADATDDVKRLGEALLTVNDRHERLIEGLLTLAGGEQPVRDGTPIDLAEVAAHVVDQTTLTREVRVHRRLEPAIVGGDPILVERLVQNLIDNAIQHNHDGGEVWIRTEPGTLVVSNTGPVVATYELELIFEPFGRLAGERTRSDRGVGLGLSIVRAIAQAHGGTVAATPREGGGLTMTVEFPQCE